jgi:hypothetical protein
MQELLGELVSLEEELLWYEYYYEEFFQVQVLISFI